jgi:hypothetical protein
MAVNQGIYLRHRSGANHEYSGRRASKLRRELEAGRGGQIITGLLLSGYVGFLGPDGEIWQLEEMKAEHIQ